MHYSFSYHYPLEVPPDKRKADTKILTTAATPVARIWSSSVTFKELHIGIIKEIWRDYYVVFGKYSEIQWSRLIFIVKTQTCDIIKRNEEM